ncbi:MAG: hypothetical protein JSU04_03135 [Bdellovibrionales bacterium]|nr:hypothetical protein [Bdellovibrionales bacterium]
MKNIFVAVAIAFMNLSAFAAEKSQTNVGNGSMMTAVKKLELSADGDPKKGTHSYYYQYWDMKKMSMAAAKKAAPGLCEFRAIIKDGPKAITIPAKSKYKISNTERSQEGGELPAGCLVLDAVFEGNETVSTPQLQIACCSEKPLATDAQQSAFTQLVEKSLKPLVVFSR